MPRALNRSIRQNVTQRNGKFLMSARVRHSGYPAAVTNETHRLAGSFDDPESSFLRDFFNFCHRFKTGIVQIALRACPSKGSSVAYPDKFT